mmetsp:Transcript_123009/g.237171  ORF Transcript_123009/g.237171 Transcript_123009/m.237171 type:complete len:222 (-) Transcript_123009:62-727(-)
MLLLKHLHLLWLSARTCLTSNHYAPSPTPPAWPQQRPCLKQQNSWQLPALPLLQKLCSYGLPDPAPKLRAALSLGQPLPQQQPWQPQKLQEPKQPSKHLHPLWLSGLTCLILNHHVAFLNPPTWLQEQRCLKQLSSWQLPGLQLLQQLGVSGLPSQPPDRRVAPPISPASTQLQSWQTQMPPVLTQLSKHLHLLVLSALTSLPVSHRAASATVPAWPQQKP